MLWTPVSCFPAQRKAASCLTNATRLSNTICTVADMRVLEQKMLLDKTTVGYYVMLEAAMSTLPEAGQDRDPTESPGDCYHAHQYPFSGLGTKSAGTKPFRKYLTNVFKVG